LKKFTLPVQTIMANPILFDCFAFIVGLCIGSFLNVCIYRIPLSKSIASPGSMCPHCQTPIRFYDNIPVFSYLWLKGRCRHCQARVSLRYPIVEFLGGLIALSCFLKYGFSVDAMIYFIFMAALLAITFIDIDHRIIPDVISLPGILLGLGASFLLVDMSPLQSLIGILAGGGILWGVAWGYSFFMKKEGMGGGDIKLLAMIGAFVGWRGVTFTIFTASLIGTLVGLLVMWQTRQNMKLAVPFGPFLAMGATLYILFGPELIGWYFGTLG
jgi:leader peptidase (prepilin peptidase)/N-methyltransferase